MLRKRPLIIPYPRGGAYPQFFGKGEGKEEAVRPRVGVRRKGMLTKRGNAHSCEEEGRGKKA
ncbi:MAG: hypothetical protein F6K24_34530 [Okeania sp. SIO2D1]|nr:hypothetical protein [Okeania sp. SIO2D1]